jgi:IgA peptidase M64
MLEKPFDPSALRRAEPGIYLFVHISRENVEVLRAARIERAPRGHLREPWVTWDTRAQFEQSVSELCLALFDERGTIIESFGWPAEAETFVDSQDDSGEPQSREPRLRGSTVRDYEWDARFRIPMSDAARYLQFYRTDLVLDQRAGPSLAWQPLALYDLKPGGPGDVPPFPVPHPSPPIPMPFPPSIIPKKAWWEIRWIQRYQSKSAYVSPGGYIKDWQTLINTGDPATRFDVVITGDGFQDAEMSTFDNYAALVTESLTTTPPFLDLADRISVHVVRVVSFDSGISRCPNPSSIAFKNTYFKTTGCWNDQPSPTFIGTSWTWKILDAVDHVIPQQYADLVITIVNCPKYGGSAPPELGMAFLTTDPSQTRFKHTAAHEAAHVIGRLCEEYNPCNARDPLRTYKNEATQAEVNANTVWWKSLAVAGELDAGGAFKVIHRLGDPVTGSMCQPNLGSAEYAMLGAFWGCHNGDPAATPTNPASNFCDQRGAPFYRGMSECRMRYHGFKFCRVCSKLLTDAVLAIAP